MHWHKKNSNWKVVENKKVEERVVDDHSDNNKKKTPENLFLSSSWGEE